MTEKPLSDSKEECEQLLEAQRKSGKKALVCHVLRYAPAFLKVAELIDNGEIGRLVAINAMERVQYWHQAHSYVRGNWRVAEETTPMILAKCCHDLDLIQYYAKSKCVSVSSVGDLTYFKEENAPKGAAKRCVDCPLQETCEFNAVKFYNDNWKANGYAASCWPTGVLVDEPITQEKLDKALAEGPYGRCVFHCDNNVVDHQFTQMTFENGVKANLLMTAFTAGGGRRMHFLGTHGDLTLEEMESCIYLHKFGKPVEKIDTRHLSDNGYGHGGGDLCLIQTLYAMLEGTAECATSLDASVESHLIGICAEKSRLLGGELIKVHE
jgi:predicted dehydrogenase